jgi:hypothetical protein
VKVIRAFEWSAARNDFAEVPLDRL